MVNNEIKLENRLHNENKEKLKISDRFRPFPTISDRSETVERSRNPTWGGDLFKVLQLEI